MCIRDSPRRAPCQGRPVHPPVRRRALRARRPLTTAERLSMHGPRLTASHGHTGTRAHGHTGTRAHVKLSHPRREEPRPTMPTHPARTSFAPSPATGTRRSATDAVASYVLDTCVLLADPRALYR